MTTPRFADSREVIRCDHCRLVQFRTTNRICRRCHWSLDKDEVDLAAPTTPVLPTNGKGRIDVANSIRSLRMRKGLSQRQLAGRLSVSRTYLSKIENEKAMPKMSSLERFARALEVTIPDLLSTTERRHQEEVRELMEDQFIADILPYATKLNGPQMSSILMQVTQISSTPRSNA